MDLIKTNLRKTNSKRINSKRIVSVLFLIILLTAFAPAGFAVISKASLPVYAVVSGSDEAIQATLSIEIEPGNGNIYTKVGPLVGTSTQNTEKIAVELAREYFDKVDDYDYKFNIESGASIVEGPSAGAAMALLLVSMLQDKELPKTVAVTGSINSDGSIGQVGGVFLKAKTASQTGIKLFLVPRGEALQTIKIDGTIKTVDLTQYGWQEWGIKIIEVDTLDDLLKYAFIAPEEIDIQEIASQKPPIFVPEAIQLNKKLQVMREFSESYLEEANTKINSAKGSLANTILNDAAIESTLYTSIAQAEKTLDDAKRLLDQNYLYSAANYAFLTIVNASIVEDISSDPSLLQVNSITFTQKIADLKKEIDALKKQLDSRLPVENIEWNLAAKERLAWAMLKIIKIKSNQEILPTGLTAIAIAVENLREYEFAKAWTNIAKNFHEFSAQDSKFVEIEGLFDEKAAEYIAKAEKELTVLSIEDAEDISRRLQGAYIEKEEGWDLAAVLDAASAYGLARAAKESQGKTLNELIEMLETKTTDLQKKLSENKNEFVWSQMYLDHANYFFKSAKFYKDYNNTIQAKSDAESAVSLVMFAEAIFEVMADAYEEIEKLPISNGKGKTIGQEKTITQEKEISEKSQEKEVSEKSEQESPALTQLSSISLNTILLGILIMLVVIFLLLLAYFFKTTTVSFEVSEEASVEEKIKQIAAIQKQLDKALLEGRISEQKHTELVNKYNGYLKKLLKEQEDKSVHLINLDRVETELAAQKYLLRKIERQYKNKKIRKTEFENTKRLLENEIISLEEELKNRKIALLKDDDEIRKIRIEKPVLDEEKERKEKIEQKKLKKGQKTLKKGKRKQQKLKRKK